MADCVEKVLFRLGLKILRAAGASLSLRGEGPHELPQKRSLALVSILQRLAAAEIAQCATFVRFSEPRDFRVFQHNPPGERTSSGCLGMSEKCHTGLTCHFPVIFEKRIVALKLLQCSLRK